MKENNIISLFHHIHHEDGEHKVHHCGGAHKDIDPTVDYSIEHCSHGKHRIDKEVAIGHATSRNLEPFEVKIRFTEPCDDGGWHIESGELAE